jgi:hypothetical protein
MQVRIIKKMGDQLSAVPRWPLFDGILLLVESTLFRIEREKPQAEEIYRPFPIGDFPMTEPSPAHSPP